MVPGHQQALAVLPTWLTTTIRAKITSGRRVDKLTFQLWVTNEQLNTIKAGSVYRINGTDLIEVTDGPSETAFIGESRLLLNCSGKSSAFE